VVHGQNDPPADPASGASTPPELASSSAEGRDVSVSLLPANFLRDQKNIWLFPAELAKGRHWSPTVAVIAATVGLLSADPHVDPYFAHTTAFRGFDRAFASNVTGAETVAIPAALYAVGLGRRDSYAQKTALFAGEALADAEVLRAVMNTVTARWRPSDVVRRGNYADTFFRDNIHVGSSFPSGHMIAAVSIGTVIARRYRKHRWVPWAAYGLAGTIGFSRISLRAHFPSDVVLGTVLGYAIARYDVLQDH
jgi:membrane-associated phospholipid phosphatase